jgi:hypothetical protein
MIYIFKITDGFYKKNNLNNNHNGWVRFVIGVGEAQIETRKQISLGL